MATFGSPPYRHPAPPPVERTARGRLATIGLVLGSTSVVCHLTLVPALLRGWIVFFWTMLLVEHALGVGAIVAAGMARSALLAPGEPDCSARVSRASLLGAIGFGAPAAELALVYGAGMLVRYLHH